jgi:drug/metabolite transporter (DMT)-like permease
MTRALGASVFLVLAYTVAMLAAGRLPPSYAASAAFLMPLIALAAAWWAVAPERKRNP